MSSQTHASAQGLALAANEPPLKRAPTLYAIIYFKIIKGALFFALGIVMFCQASHDLPGEWENFLNKPTVEQVLKNLKIHPENKFFQRVADQLADLTEKRVKLWAMGTMLFSLFPLTEGIGMLYRAGWAGWLTIGESAFFVPIEMFDLARKFSSFMLLVMIVNILIVWYLYANRQTLFHHHHFHHRHSKSVS